ncbi:MAG TPA: DNA methyltransferase, partial [Vicinamibacterales bacterium]|nr:DNA methyltransferase [Vicinamibacterales bacterium]
MTARPTPYASLRHPNGSSLDFFLGDCLELLPCLASERVDVVVTSPPYNLGVKYRSYQDTVPRDRYLEWTGEWVQAVRAIMGPGASLFLNVGAKPKDPWVAMDIAQAVRPHLRLQNTVLWVKSIVIERAAAGEDAMPLVPTGLPAGRLDGAVRAALLCRLPTVPFLRPAG